MKSRNWVVRFGVFQVDLEARELRRHGLRIKLQEKPFQVLALLLEHRGQVVTREELREKLWPADTFVDFDHSVNTAVNKLREALGDSAENPRFIETIPRRGYRFIAPVEVVEATAGLTTTAEPVPTVAGRRARIHPVWWLVPALAILVTVGYGAWHRFGPRVQPPDRVMLAVLPLENLSGDPGQEYFSDGLTEEMITQLSRLQPERLGVIARTSAMYYKGTKKRVDEIGHELGVDFVLEGSVRREAERVRISARLIRVGDQITVWTKSYEWDIQDILALQSDIASTIAREISLTLTPQVQARLARTSLVSPQAYEFYLKGRYLWNQRTPEDLRKAIAQFQQAVREDANFAPAYAGLADCYNLLSIYLVASPQEAFPRARAAALRALELDQTLASAHAALGYTRFRFDWDWEKAEEAFRRAIELEPSYATAHHWYGEYLVAMRRFKEGLAEIEIARKLDPLSLIISADAGWFHHLAGQQELAVQHLQRTIELAPDFAPAYIYLGEIYIRKGMYPEAIAACQKGIELSRGGSKPACLAYAYARAGRRTEAMKIIEELKHRAYPSPVSIAIIYAGLGENEEALAWLERAYQERNDFLVHLQSQPLFDPLRSDARFRNLVGRIGLPQ
ncbi:MAG: winged helix-turn-helix domain-containing protein [Acidobacteriia bacterium]|nr:winged helix-turn-helix domain-containing protein [Terriglobia bacterium]